MRVIEFNYARHPRRDIPLIPLRLRTTRKWREVWVYVDSGSFYSIFDEKIAEILDIDVSSGKKLFVVVGDGSFIPIYFHNVSIKLADHEFAMRVAFSPKLGVGFNLLGMDFFDNFRVTFDNKSKKVTFEEQSQIG